MQDQPDLTQLTIAVRRANKAKRATKFARFKPLDYQREWFETDRPIRVYPSLTRAERRLAARSSCSRPASGINP